MMYHVSLSSPCTYKTAIYHCILSNLLLINECEMISFRCITNYSRRACSNDCLFFFIPFFKLPFAIVWFRIYINHKLITPENSLRSFFLQIFAGFFLFDSYSLTFSLFRKVLDAWILLNFIAFFDELSFSVTSPRATRLRSLIFKRFYSVWAI